MLGTGRFDASAAVKKVALALPSPKLKTMLRSLTVRRLVLSAFCVLHVLLPWRGRRRGCVEFAEAWQARVTSNRTPTSRIAAIWITAYSARPPGNISALLPRAFSSVDLYSHSAALEHRPIAPRQSLIQAHHSRAPPIS